MKLKKPDLTKPAFLYNHQARMCIKQGLCPTCVRPIVESEFKDDLSKREFSISGMCQKCQDTLFEQATDGWGSF